MEAIASTPKSLTVGIPCFNEALTIGKVVDDFRRVFPHAVILVVDNASTDETAAIARTHGATVIHEPRRGKGCAVQKLFRAANSDYLIMVDGDDTYPAEEALKLLSVIERQPCDTVVGRRVSDNAAAFKATHTWANDALVRLIEMMFRAHCGDLFSGYRLFTRAFYRTVPMLATGFEVETELAIQTIDKGFVQRDVEIEFRSRPEGSVSKLSTFKDGLRVLRTILAVVKDFKPLMFFSSISILLFVASLGAGSFPILDYVHYHYVYHVPLAVLATGLGLLAALSLACGLILDTFVRYQREQFFLRIRNLGSSDEIMSSSPSIQKPSVRNPTRC